MKTGKTLHGSANLAFDATDAITHIAEGMFRNIAATPWPLGTAPEGPALGIAGFVHAAIRRVNGAARETSNQLLGRLSPGLDRTLAPGPHREAAISALNGICGDHLAQSNNTLAIPMQFRVLLPPLHTPKEPDVATTARAPDSGSAPSPVRKIPFANLLEVERRPVEVYPQPDALSEQGFTAGRRLLILAHGLCMNDRTWTSHQHNHAEALAESNDYTAIYLLYNSGRNVSTNGRELCEQLEGLVDTWPVPIESITLIGFSMGGLLARSAMHCAQAEGCAWLDKVDKAIYLGTPHHGAVLERGGYWLQKSFTFSPYTAPFSALGRIRSAGITDLRHGNVRDEDWQLHDEHEDNADHRIPTLLAPGIEHYAIAATASVAPDAKCEEPFGKLRGDGLVHPASALGVHENKDFELDFPMGQAKIIYNLGHLGMLHDVRVLEQLKQWLA